MWLTLAKKGTTRPTSLSYAQALQEALCQGWDRRAGHEHRRAHLPAAVHAPVGPQPVVRAQRRLRRRADRAGPDAAQRRGRGRAAQADGRWDAAYAGPASIEVPDDLAAALDAEPVARALLDELDAQNRYAMVFRVCGAVDDRCPGTRSLPPWTVNRTDCRAAGRRRRGRDRRDAREVRLDQLLGEPGSPGTTPTTTATVGTSSFACATSTRSIPVRPGFLAPSDSSCVGARVRPTRSGAPAHRASAVMSVRAPDALGVVRAA